MCACVAAPCGGRVHGRAVPAVLFPAVGLLFAALLVSGVVVPQTEWLSLPERLHDVRDKPRDGWMHVLGIVLTLFGIESVANLAAAVRDGSARRAKDAAGPVVVALTALGAIVCVAIVAALSDAPYGGIDRSVLAFLGSDYAEQWVELAVHVVGEAVLLSATSAVVTPRDKTLPRAREFSGRAQHAGFATGSFPKRLLHFANENAPLAITNAADANSANRSVQ